MNGDSKTQFPPSLNSFALPYNIDDIQSNSNDFQDILELKKYIDADLSDYVSKYIRRFVMRRLNSKVKCEVCYSVLLDNGLPTGQIQAKSYDSNSNLIKPSPDITYICNYAETVFCLSQKNLCMNEKEYYSTYDDIGFKRNYTIISI